MFIFIFQIRTLRLGEYSSQRNSIVLGGAEIIVSDSRRYTLNQYTIMLLEDHAWDNYPFPSISSVFNSVSTIIIYTFMKSVKPGGSR